MGKCNIPFPRKLYGWTPVAKLNIGATTIAANLGMGDQAEITIMTGDSIISIVVNGRALKDFNELIEATLRGFDHRALNTNNSKLEYWDEA